MQHDLFPHSSTPIHPGRKLAARVAGAYRATGRDFVTEPAEALDVGFDGIAGDVHAGITRRTGGREPWYRRGTEIRNERQLTIVAPDDLDAIATAMGIERILPEWIGANLLLTGVPHLSMLPPGTLLFFPEGPTLKIDGQNVPCRLAGRSVARHAGMADPEAGELAFPKAARRLRGLVAWVEKPGTIAVGDDVSVRVPEQWIWTGA